MENSNKANVSFEENKTNTGKKSNKKFENDIGLGMRVTQKFTAKLTKP